MKNLFISLFCILLVSPLFAHSHEAHVHGKAELKILYNKDSLELDITVPGMDFCGFEYSDLNPDDEQKVELIIESLQDKMEPPAFLMGSWGHRINPSMINVLRPESHDQHSEDDDSHDESEEGHSEYRIQIVFNLTGQKAPRKLDLSPVFSKFESLNEMDWVLLSATGQSAGEVTPKKSRIHL